MVAGITYRIDQLASTFYFRPCALTDVVRACGAFQSALLFVFISNVLFIERVLRSILKNYAIVLGLDFS